LGERHEQDAVFHLRGDALRVDAVDREGALETTVILATNHTLPSSFCSVLVDLLAADDERVILVADLDLITRQTRISSSTT
jgi:hypothetical protein